MSGRHGYVNCAGAVALLDPDTPPFPEAAWKIGESTVEFGAHYLAEYLQSIGSKMSIVRGPVAVACSN